MFVSLIVLIVFAINFDAKDENASASLLPLMGIILFTGSATTCLAFLWFMRSSIRTQKIAASSNTSVWMLFFLVSLLLSLIDCVALLTAGLLKPFVTNIVEIVLISCDMLLIGWCIFKLKALPSDVPSAPEKATQ